MSGYLLKVPYSTRGSYKLEIKIRGSLSIVRPPCLRFCRPPHAKKPMLKRLGLDLEWEFGKSAQATAKDDAQAL